MWTQKRTHSLPAIYHSSHFFFCCLSGNSLPRHPSKPCPPAPPCQYPRTDGTLIILSYYGYHFNLSLLQKHFPPISKSTSTSKWFWVWLLFQPHKCLGITQNGCYFYFPGLCKPLWSWESKLFKSNWPRFKKGKCINPYAKPPGCGRPCYANGMMLPGTFLVFPFIINKQSHSLTCPP